MMLNEEVRERLAEMEMLGTFDPVEHKYHWNSDRELESVTRRIGSWEFPFEAEKHAARVALREGRSTEEVLADWEANRDAAAALGSRVHQGIEDRLLGVTVAREWCPESLRRLAVWEKWWAKQGPRLEVVAVELRVFSPKRGVAGTMDLLARNKATGELHILDWKSNKRFGVGRDGFEYLKHPFAHLRANEHHKYSLQIAAYRLILEEWGIPTNGGTLVHLGPRMEEAKAHRAIDLTDLLSKVL